MGFDQSATDEIDGEDITPSSVSTDELSTSARLADIVVHQPDTDWIANGDDGQVASGSDPETVIQAAVDSFADDDGIVHVHDLDPSSVSVSLDGRETVIYSYNGNEWIQTHHNDGIRFWGTGVNGDYAGLKWYPEQSGTDGLDADVTVTAHKYKDDGTVDQHLSIYTGDGAGSENKRLDVPYGSSTVTPRWQNIDLMEFEGDVAIRKDNKVATDGTLRLPQTPNIRFRNDADDGQVTIVNTFSDDKVRFGDVDNAGVQIYSGGGPIQTNVDISMGSDSVLNQGKTNLTKRSSPPSSPTDGDIAYADGTNWDPGSGAGFYGYEEGAWVKF